MFHFALQSAMRLLAPQKLNILIFHQVFDETDPMRPHEPSANVFDWQMRLISKYFTPLSINEALQLLKNNNLPANAVCVTFDDGYVNNLTIATPILKKYNVPATVYVATGFCHGQNMWNDQVIDFIANRDSAPINLTAVDMEDHCVSNWTEKRQLAEKLIGNLKYQEFERRLEIIEQLYIDNQQQHHPAKMMTPEQIRALAGEGIDIGAHTIDHPILTTLNADSQYRQMNTSKSQLEEWLDKPVTGFAYPNGKREKDYNDISVEQVKKIGFDYAVSTNWGVNSKGDSHFELNRFTPWDDTSTRFHLRMLRNAI